MKPSPRFLAVVTELAHLLNLAVEPSEDMLGLEFETAHHTVRVLPHPQDAQRFLIAVDVLSTADGTPPSAWMMLLRLNLAAIAEHGWVIGLEEGGTLVLSRAVDLASTDPSTLESLMADGLDRAEALANLWNIACGLPNSLTGEAEGTTDLEMVFRKA
jgi:hypothetical protein